MPDFDINLFTIIFGTIIFGLGYVGMSLKHLVLGKDFKKLKAFDKTLQSLILGTISFFVTLNLEVKLPEVTEVEILKLILESPQVVLFQLLIIGVIIFYWIGIEISIKETFGSERGKKFLKHFKKVFLPPKKQK